MDEFITPAGSELAVSADLPTTNDDTGFEALTTWEDLPIATDFGEGGPTDNIVTFIPVQGSAVQKAQGSRDFGARTVPMAYVSGDAGVAVLRTAHSARNRISWRLTLPTGDIEYGVANCDGVRTITGIPLRLPYVHSLRRTL